MRKNKNILILIISLWCAIEFVISPYPYYAKVNGIFPTINLVGFSFDLSEILIYGFIGFSLLLLSIKFIKNPKISLGYGYHKYLVLSFIAVLFASVIVGFFNRGPTFLVMIRVDIILLLFIIFMNLYNIKTIANSIVKIIYIVGIVNAIVAFLSFFKIEIWKITIYPDFQSYMIHMWFGLYMSIFSYAILLNKIILKNRVSFFDLLFVILILSVVIINITNKPIFLTMLIVTFTTLVVFFKSKIRRVRVVIMGVIIFLSPVFVYLSLDSDKQVQFINVVSQRFLKQDAFTWSDVKDNMSSIATSGGQDVSAGRFELWKSYLTTVADTPIISDNYGKRHWTELSALNNTKVAFGSHNDIVHYTHYAGYIAGISLVLIILFFIRETFEYKTRLIYCRIAIQYNVKEYEFHGMLAFIYAVIGNEMIGGALSNAKFSWFWWLILVFVLKVIAEARGKGQNNILFGVNEVKPAIQSKKQPIVT